MKILLLLVVALSTAILLSLKRNVKRSLPFEKSSEPYEWRWKVHFFEKRSNFRVDSSLKHKFTRYNTRIKNWCITWFSVSCTFCRIFSLKFFFRGGQQHSRQPFGQLPRHQKINQFPSGNTWRSRSQSSTWQICEHHRPTNSKQEILLSVSFGFFSPKNKLPHLQKERVANKNETCFGFFLFDLGFFIWGWKWFCGHFAQKITKVTSRNQVGSGIESQVPFVWNVGPLNENIARYKRANLTINKSWVTSKSCKLISLHTCVKSNVKNTNNM